MDPDVFITIAFGFEAFLFAVAAAFYVAHEVRRAQAEPKPSLSATSEVN